MLSRHARYSKSHIHVRFYHTPSAELSHIRSRGGAARSCSSGTRGRRGPLPSWSRWWARPLRAAACNFDTATATMQFVEGLDNNLPWIKAWDIYYKLGVDGISVLFVALTALLTTISIMVSWKAVTERVREFMAAMLFLEAGMIGVFTALDLFLFYIFWEAMLIPMYLLIGVWGGPNRFTPRSSSSCTPSSAACSCSLRSWRCTSRQARPSTSWRSCNQVQLHLPALCVRGLLRGLRGERCSCSPFHTWLPDAHVRRRQQEASSWPASSSRWGPTASSVLPAVLPGRSHELDARNYGSVGDRDHLRRVHGLCPDGLQAHRLFQRRRMGFVTLGIFALNSQGLEGGILQMLDHGVSTGALFLAVGIIYERTHTRMIADYGGIAARVPVYATFLMIITLSSIGCPARTGLSESSRSFWGHSSIRRPTPSSPPSALSSGPDICSGCTSALPSARSRTRTTSTRRT